MNRKDKIVEGMMVGGLLVTAVAGVAGTAYIADSNRVHCKCPHTNTEYKGQFGRKFTCVEFHHTEECEGKR